MQKFLTDLQGDNICQGPTLQTYASPLESKNKVYTVSNLAMLILAF